MPEGQREASSGACFPETTFHTELLPTDETPVAFDDPSSSSIRGGNEATEPLRRAKLRRCGATTKEALSKACQALHSGLPVAFPTETVYGLSANALSAHACRAIFAAKGRPQDNPLIVHVSDLEMAQGVVKAGWVAPKAYASLMKRFWPGGITFLMPGARANEQSGPSTSTSPPQPSPAFFCGTGTLAVASVVTANQPLVGVRLPSHPLARALISESNLPLAAPSANASGRPSPTSAQHVMYDLGGGLEAPKPTRDDRPRGRIPYIIDGGSSRQGVESTVVDGVTEPGELRILRPGAVGAEEIEECLRADGIGPSEVALRVYGKDMQRQTDMEANPTTPGMKYRHYSPTAPVTVFVASQGQLGPGLQPPSWLAALTKEVQEWRAAQPYTQGAAPRHLPLRIGLMLLSDSPLCDAIQSEPCVQLDGPSRAWFQSQRQHADEDPQAHSRLHCTDRLIDAQELKACLGPPFTIDLPTSHSEPTASGETVPPTSNTNNVEVLPFSLGTRKDPTLAARRLFSGLRTLDDERLVASALQAAPRATNGQSKGCQLSESSGVGPSHGPVDLIIIEAVDDSGIGLAVMNRVGKAAGASVLVST
ncbi:unnamed protein product [Parajaminaea phylloscopi]